MIQRMTRRRGLTIGAVAACLVLLAMVGVMIFREVRATASLATLCDTVTTLNEERNDAVPVSTGGPVAVILGDSYAQGQYLERPREQAWSTLVAEEEGWTAYVNAVGGSGVTREGPCGGQSYADRVGEVLAFSPSVVVVQASVNDAASDEFTAAMDDLLDQLSAVPRVIVVGPISTPTLDASRAATLARDSATAHGREYIGVDDGAGLTFVDDGVHLTPEGHEVYAAIVSNGIG